VLRVRVIPRAARTAVAGERGGALLVRLSAAPVDGAANDALLDYLSTCLNVARRALTLVSGDRSRDKKIWIEGLRPEQVAAAINPAGDA
jgi:uncharacterized protein YggU (UPF0235/DUF167 family)